VTPVVALIAGYLLGAVPTADWLAALRGHDLRRSGSGNPGANNALRVGGHRLGASILAAELAKGCLCAATGWVLAGEPGMTLACLGAVNGNIYNPYRHLQGGQGLGITAGVLLTAAPLVGVVAVATTVATVIVTRSSPLAALTGITATVASAAWLNPGLWGLQTRQWILVLAFGAAASIAPKQWGKIRRRGRLAPPTPG
jgi:acyl phosphate:glycerol-3-phosphate acyltransferase